MKVNGKDYKTVWMDGLTIKTIDQRLLPKHFKIIALKDYKEVAKAIKDMAIRGAPAIGAIGAYALAQAVNQNKDIKKAKKTLEMTRPTAYDLIHGLNFVFNRIKNQAINKAKPVSLRAAQEYADKNKRACRKIGEFGEKLIKNNFKILTHCNAGALATVDYGTALAPIRLAHYNKKNIFVFVDETRPRLQGSRLTAWELSQEKIPHTIIADNAAGYYMKKGEINLIITGADRIALNGDIANKIGTYEKAVLAKENKIPFYVAAPLSTIDFSCKTGNNIPIEERSQKEVLEIKNIMLAPEKSSAKNPAFDITPSKYIKGIITEKGIFSPRDIKRLR